MTLDTQKAMAHAVETAKIKVEEEKKRHNGIVEKLFASDFWPIRVKREGVQVDEDALLDEEVGVRMRRGSLTQVPYIRDVGSATQDTILFSDRQRGPTEHEAEATSAVYLLNA